MTADPSHFHHLFLAHSESQICIVTSRYDQRHCKGYLAEEIMCVCSEGQRSTAMPTFPARLCQMEERFED